MVGFSSGVIVFFFPLGLSYGCSSPTSKRDLIQLMIFSLILNKPSKNKECEERRMRKLDSAEKSPLPVSRDELFTVVKG